jgi:hypothetical protein
MTDEHIFFKFHRAANPREKAYTVVFKRNPEAFWYDDYKEMEMDYSVTNPFLEFADAADEDMMMRINF